MTVAKAIYTRILIGGYQLSGQTNKVAVKLDAKKTDVTPFEATAQEFIVMDPEPSIDLQGYIHLAATGAGTYEKISLDALDTPDVVAVLRSTSATFTGVPAMVLPNATAINMNQDFPVDGVMTIAATWGGATAMRRGIAAYCGTVTATGAKASVDLGAQGTTGGWAHLFVTSITGTAEDATFDIESSATQGGTYASEGTFTLSAIGAYAVDLSGTVNRWVRLNCTDMGDATGFAVNAIVCVKGVTQ